MQTSKYHFFTLFVLMFFSSAVAAQNVGIGTTTPRQKLHVEGNTYIRDSLGIGIDSGKANLDIKGTVLFRGINSNDYAGWPAASVEFATGRSIYNSPVPGLYKGDIAFSYAGPEGGYRHFISSYHSGFNGAYYNGLMFYINTSATPGGSESPGYGNTNAMTLTSAGLALGATFPSERLHVQGNTLLRGKTVIGTNYNAYVFDNTADLDVNGTAIFKGGNPASSYYTGPLAAGVEFLFGRNAYGALTSGYNNADIAFNYGDYEGGFRHFLSTRHENAVNSSGNAIDFYINNSADRAGSVSLGSGNKLALSVTAAGIGISKSNPSKALDVNGSAEVAGDLSVKRILTADTISTVSGLTVQSNTKIIGKLSATDSLAGGSLGIQTNARIGGKLSVLDSLIAPSLRIQTNARISGKLTTGDSLTASILSVQNNARVGAKLTVGDTLFVTKIAPENIQPATLQNGWTNHGGGFTDAGFWKDREGVVHLQGLIKDGSTGISTVLFTLPPGYRPPARQIYTVMSNNVITRIDILGSGEVITAGTMSSLWVNLTGIYFRTN